MAIVLNQFEGIAPKIDKRQLADNAAQVAINTNMESANMTPYLQPLDIGVTVPVGTRSIYPYNGSWLKWGMDMYVQKGPVSEDVYKRIYYTGDGAPKVRGIINSVEVETPLGLPKPAQKLTVTIEPITATTWTRVWHYFYEEPDGTQKDAGALSSVTETTPAKLYALSSIPARVTASSSAQFIAWFEARSSDGSTIGRVYASSSLYSDESDLFIDGAKTTFSQSVSGSSATFTITYDTGTSADYTQDRSWVYTYVTEFGEEGPPSSPTDVTAYSPAQQAKLTGFSPPPVFGGYNIKKFRLYRTVTSNSATEYQFVDEFDVSQLTYTDRITDGDTNEILPSDNWDAPPSDLDGLVSLPGAFFAGFSGKSVYFSVPNYPHAWPTEYALNMKDDIVGLGVSGATLLVATTGRPYQITVPDPSSATPIEIPYNQSCVSGQSVVGFSGSVCYASPDGLITVAGATAMNFTDKLFLNNQWNDLVPSSLKTATYDDKMYLFFDNKTYIFNILDTAQVLTETDQVSRAIYSDVETDSLYFVKNDKIYSWDKGASNLTMTWKSKEFVFPKPNWVGVVRVTSYAYPVTMKLYANDVQVASMTITSNLPVRTPLLNREKFWSFSVESSSTITEVLLSQSMQDLSANAATA